MSVRSQIHIKESHMLFFSFARRKRIKEFFTQVVEFEGYLCKNNCVGIKKKEKILNLTSLTTQISRFTDASFCKVVNFFFFGF